MQNVFKGDPMKKLKMALIIAGTAWSLPAHADKLDLTNMKCSQFVQAGKESASVITAWLTGYYTDATEAEVIDLARLKDTGDKLSTFCAANPNFAVAAASEGLLGK
jgi:hypothetical protein